MKKKIEKIIEKNKEELKPIMADKMQVFLNMKGMDHLSLFDLINSIVMDSNILVTQNELILGIRDKLTKRIKDFRILTPQEANKILAQKDTEINKPYNLTG